MTYRNRFNEDQIREFDDAFSMFDRDGYGAISTLELREMLKTIGYNPTDVTLENLTIVVDDGNGMINFDEFMELIDHLETEEKNRKEARDCFNAFDFNGEGWVAANDIKETLLFVMETATTADKEGIIKFFRLEKNRKIFFEEFLNMVCCFKPTSVHTPVV